MSSIDIFISYARTDLQRVLHIYQSLKKEGYKPWLDIEEVLPGQDWEMAIERAIENATFFMACLSQKSVNKFGVVQKELNLALKMLDMQPEGRLYLIPVRLEECEVPGRFSKLQWCDIFKKDGTANLLSAISEGIKQRGMACLAAKINKGPDKGSCFRIFSNLITVGRASSCDIVLGDMKVSALHAKIELRGDRLLYSHLSENNPSIIENAQGSIKLTATGKRYFNLNSGDVIKIGNSDFTVDLIGREIMKNIRSTEV